MQITIRGYESRDLPLMVAIGVEFVKILFVDFLN